jgi:hypothetical protein
MLLGLEGADYFLRFTFVIGPGANVREAGPTTRARFEVLRHHFKPPCTKSVDAKRHINGVADVIVGECPSGLKLAGRKTSCAVEHVTLTLQLPQFSQEILAVALSHSLFSCSGRPLGRGST